MITRIEVDGFKSLTDFSLDFQPGLNIMVGPNGAGKTNIIQFLEFLSGIAGVSIDRVMNELGGAGVVFKKVGDASYNNLIRAKATGHVEYFRRGNAEIQYCGYEYSFEIEKDGLTFVFQELKLKFSNAEKWEIHLQAKNNAKESILEILEGKDHPVTEHLRDTIFLPRYSLIWLLSSFSSTDHFFLNVLTNDFRENQNYFIVPDKVREPEDANSLAIINKNGVGLASALFAMQPHTDAETAVNRFINSLLNEDTFIKIVKQLKNANNSIDDISVSKDFNNRLVVKVFIKSGDYYSALPLSSMSDGTLKWLALITIIFTSSYGFSIEEVENYLHPWMQAEIVSIIRDQLEYKNSVALLTTHSETLINTAKPEEIILVDFKDGKTIAKRLDADTMLSVKEAISNSGLGLGHFYFSNILQDA